MSSGVNTIGQRLVVGFAGTDVQDREVLLVADQIRSGLVGGVLLFRHNICSAEQLQKLTQFLHSAAVDEPLFVFVDQEGGRVQRLGSSNGFPDYLSAKAVASQMSTDEAFSHYAELGAVLRDSGCNFDFAPCVDLDGEPPCEAIGKHERSYSPDPEVVAEYSRMFIRGLKESGILSCAKHFPGHGLARGDTHKGIVDVTETWREEELVPYRLLQDSADLDSVMIAHIIHQTVDPDIPASLSEMWLRKLRDQIGFAGMTVSDDLHMGAIQQHFDFKEVVRRSIVAGVDLLVFSNNPTAAQGVAEFAPDPQLPIRFQEVIAELLVDGAVTQEQCDSGVKRVLAMKSKLSSQ
jgi:beta-N-acetylhexosaminidase